MQSHEQAARIASRLGVRVSLATADEPLPAQALTPRELARWKSFASAPAARDWLLGRAALKALVPGDTANLTFPHRAVSISHSGGVGVAVHSTRRLAGIGVDFERWRAQVHPRMAPFFLHPAEREFAGTSAALVRLWTVKEALFKALPDNGKRVLLDLEIDEPAATCGTARGPRGETLRYASGDIGCGSLSIAVTPMGGDHGGV